MDKKGRGGGAARRGGRPGGSRGGGRMSKGGEHCDLIAMVDNFSWGEEEIQQKRGDSE